MLIPASVRSNRRIAFPFAVSSTLHLHNRSGHIYWHHFHDDYLVIHTDAIGHDDYQLVHDFDPNQYRTKVLEGDGAIRPPASINDTLKQELSRRYDTLEDFLYDWTDITTSDDIDRVWEQNESYFQSRTEFDETLDQEVSPTAFYLTVGGVELQGTPPVFILTQDQIGGLLNRGMAYDTVIEDLLEYPRMVGLIHRSDFEFTGIRKDVDALVDLLQDTPLGDEPIARALHSLGYK